MPWSSKGNPLLEEFFRFSLKGTNNSAFGEVFEVENDP